VSEPKEIAKIGEWRLTRWDYPNAPLVAEIKVRGDEITVEFTDTGDLSVSWNNERFAVPDIPGAVLERLLADRDVRRAKGRGE